MNDSHNSKISTTRYWALGQLILVRLREFYRQPQALYWRYGFPILAVASLGIAFPNKSIEHITVDVQQTSLVSGVDFAHHALAQDKKYVVHVYDEATCRDRLRTGKTDLIVVPAETGRGYGYAYDPTRPESRQARGKIDDTLQRAAGRKDPLSVIDLELNGSGGRYVDFLIPGFVGLSLMSGCLWSVGFATVEMRIRNVLKRFLATPMRKTDFLAALLISRVLLQVPEVFALLLFARVAFGVIVQGSLLTFTLLVLLGLLTSSGIGLLLASRVRALESMSGLINLIMLPMWILSGVFFPIERFPEAAQPFIRMLPLQPLVETLRNVSLEGATLASQWQQISVLSAWAVVSFVLALRWFRWN